LNQARPKLGTRRKFIFDYLICVADKDVLEARIASEKRPGELAEAKRRLELAEQLRVDEIMQKQALQEAFETERNLLLKEIATLQKRQQRPKARLARWLKRSEFKRRRRAR
jgi:hypothetical protein